MRIVLRQPPPPISSPPKRRLRTPSTSTCDLVLISNRSSLRQLHKRPPFPAQSSSFKILPSHFYHHNVIPNPHKSHNNPLPPAGPHIRHRRPHHLPPDLGRPRLPRLHRPRPGRRTAQLRGLAHGHHRHPPLCALKELRDMDGRLPQRRIPPRHEGAAQKEGREGGAGRDRAA